MSYHDLVAYQKGFLLAIKIFESSKSFSIAQKDPLTDQVRRSSRTLCANIAKAYRKRDYPKHLHSKLTNSNAKN